MIKKDYDHVVEGMKVRNTEQQNIRDFLTDAKNKGHDYVAFPKKEAAQTQYMVSGHKFQNALDASRDLTFQKKYPEQQYVSAPIQKIIEKLEKIYDRPKEKTHRQERYRGNH